MGKMITCKTCGLQIAKTANRCPRCGARQHQVALTFVGLIIVATVILCVVTLLDGSSTQAAKEPSAQAANITAPELYKAYTDNEVNADNMYEDKLLAVTGTIVDIGKDMINGNPCVSLDSGAAYGLYPIQCFFTSGDKSSATLAALKNGQQITIYGDCSGTPIVNVQMSDCYIQG